MKELKAIEARADKYVVFCAKYDTLAGDDLMHADITALIAEVKRLSDPWISEPIPDDYRGIVMIKRKGSFPSSWYCSGKMIPCKNEIECWMPIPERTDNG